MQIKTSQIKKMCGLVALCMAAQQLKDVAAEVKTPSTDEIYDFCKNKGYTLQGEMFSGVILGIDQWHGGLLDGYQQDNDPHCHDLYHALPDTTAPKLDWSRVHQVFLYARQGKSRRLALWKYELLHESNIQLVEMCPIRAQESELYVVPDDGVEGGLSGKVVLLFPPR
uniref:Actin maturation protease n=1 Tax=Branchiostoma floridae TaxID=7739 RepID=C3XZH1_BRAFL|eukprot:XP_002610725.1 hypothetical protein BRAFLDRAFT_65953 [Branchiostoma floridae]